MLEATGWTAPDPDVYPTGREIVEEYLQPLAELPEISSSIRFNSRVIAVTRSGYDKMKTDGRESAPFLIQIEGPDGSEDAILARAVIDASGTWETPNPLGTSGIPAIGERAAAGQILTTASPMSLREIGDVTPDGVSWSSVAATRPSTRCSIW